VGDWRGSPLDAAALAKQRGIKVYTIGIGGGEAFTTVRPPLGEYKMPVGEGVDEATLKAIAKETGGICRLADDADSLRSVSRWTILRFTTRRTRTSPGLSTGMGSGPSENYQYLHPSGSSR